MVNKENINQYISTLKAPERAVLVDIPLEIWDFAAGYISDPRQRTIDNIAGQLLDSKECIMHDYYHMSLD